MAGEWIHATLGSVMTLQRGFDLPASERRAGRYPVVAATGLAGTHESAMVQGPGVVIGRSGSLGGGQYIKGDFWPLNTTLWVNDFKGNDPRFCYYLLKSLDLSQFNAGSGVPTLNRNHIHPLPLVAPSDPMEQRAIAHILGTIDDKIELNRRMSEMLEAIARTLFEAWFVDFAPMRAKSDGSRLDQSRLLTDLFPARLVSSELGEIPSGWQVVSLRDLVDVERGLSYKGAGLAAAGLPMHNLNSVFEGGGYKQDGLKYYQGEYKSNHLAAPGDVIVANTEQGHERRLIGYAAIVPSSFDGGSLFSHHLYRVRPKDPDRISADFLYHLLNTDVTHEVVSGYANGTTVNMLPTDGLQNPLVCLPPPALVHAFSGLTESWRKRREAIFEESRTLAALRDALLPKLISGELRVKDAERLASAVA